MAKPARLVSSLAGRWQADWAALTAVLCLQQQGIDYLLIERHLGTSLLPTEVVE